MTTSVVKICNMAIGRIRGTPIGDLTDEKVEARACTTFYESSRDFVLADCPWNFAGRTAALAKLSSTPDEWLYEYVYPSDCIEVRHLMPTSKLRQHQDPIEYEVGIAADGTKVIMTDLDAAYIRYAFSNDNVNHYSPGFVVVLSWFLGSEIAIPVAGTAKGRVLADRCMQGYQQAVRTAFAANANESDPGLNRTPETIRAHQ